MTKIHNPSAPADCTTFHAACSDGGDIELKLVDDCQAGYATMIIERAGIVVTKIIVEGVVVFDKRLPE